MLISSALGLWASFVLSTEAVTLAADPNASFSCDVSAKISCSTVGLSWQAHLLGFPNAFLGLIAEPIVITLALAALGGVRFPRWFMLTAQACYAIGFVFAYWLFLYRNAGAGGQVGVPAGAGEPAARGGTMSEGTAVTAS